MGVNILKWFSYHADSNGVHMHRLSSEYTIVLCRFVIR